MSTETELAGATGTSNRSSRRVSRRLKLAASALITGAILGITSAASASPVFELFGDTLGSGGLNPRFNSPGPASTYFNPSLLPLEHGAEGAFGLLIMKQSIGIELGARVQANDVPVEKRSAAPGPLDEVRYQDAGGFGYFGTMPTTYIVDGCDPKGTATPTGVEECSRGREPGGPRQSNGSGEATWIYTPIGLVQPLIDQYLVFGFYGIMGMAKYRLHAFHVDEMEQFFTNSLHPEMYSDRMTAQAISFGFGSQLADWVSVGISFSLNINTVAHGNAFIFDAEDQNGSLRLSTDAKTETGMKPHFGITFLPSEDFMLTATVQTETSFQLTTHIGNDLPDGEHQEAERFNVHDFMPNQVSFGGSYTIPFEDSDGAVNITAGATRNQWTDYIDRQGVNPTGTYAWRNTWNVSAGLRYIVGDTTVFSDIRYVPTPVPLQTGRTNYVDNDRTDVVGGLTQLFEAGGLLLRVGANLRGYILHRRAQDKLPPDTKALNDVDEELVFDEFPDGAIDKARGDEYERSDGLQTNNPGWPGFASSGALVGGGLSLAILY
ncbi:MAG: hypothetical protein HRU17_03105 [Polyangiaceae bacterium]|nr:hypothetical protein [Polyangiaceae bacterium]